MINVMTPQIRILFIHKIIPCLNITFDCTIIMRSENNHQKHSLLCYVQMLHTPSSKNVNVLELCTSFDKHA